MIISDKITITINPNSRKYYNSLGYECVNYEKIEIKTKDLSPGSNIKIDIRCDNCNTQSFIVYNKYFKSTKGLTEQFFCKKCNHIKAKRTKLERYGDENYNNIDVRKKTKLERYGDENYTNRQAALSTCIDNYGVTNISQIEDVKNKKRKTSLLNYGVENPFMSTEIQNNIKHTNKLKWGTEHYLASEDAKDKYNIFCNRHGVSHYSKTDEFKEKFQKTCLLKWNKKTNLLDEDTKDRIRDTNILKYGFDIAMKNKDVSLLSTKTLIDNRASFFEKLGYKYIGYDFDKVIYTLKNINCGHVFDINYDLFRSRIKYDNSSCLICYPKSELSSIKEKEIVNWLLSLNIKVIENDRSLIKKEIDIFLPDYNIGIEFNGLYYHSDKFKEKTYHIDKTNKCKDLGISLIHIWEDDWVNKKDILKSIILNKLNIVSNKVYARKCDIRLVDSKTSMIFLEKNHIQGKTPSSIRIGLYHNDELISLMTFGNRRINSKNNFELIRFCNKINTNIIGGASKIFNFFKKNYSEDKIVSYSDISMFDGKLYDILGFKNNGYTALNYYWTDLKSRYHRFNFNKKKLVKMGYDKSLTEDVIMRNIGYYKIWSCGQIRWIYE